MSESLDKSINNLVGTFTQIGEGPASYGSISTDSVCIDTSNNRIGINTLDPSYSIHVSGGDIYTDNSLIAQTISCETINTNNINTNNININNSIIVQDISVSHTLDLSTNLPTIMVRNNSYSLSKGNIYVDPSGFLRMIL